MSVPRRPESAHPAAVETGRVARFDAAVDRAAQRVPRRLAPLMWVATALGYPAVQATVLVVAGLLVEGELRTACWVLAATMIVPTVLKHTFRRERPVSVYVNAMRLPSPSFPSGHAYASMVTAGFGAYLAVTRCSGLAAAGLVIACLGWVAWVSGSRLFFRAHYGTDILGGWLAALGVLVLVLATVQP
jgi:membrane-associated phospholipid phosphatase